MQVGCRISMGVPCIRTRYPRMTDMTNLIGRNVPEERSEHIGTSSEQRLNVLSPDYWSSGIGSMRLRSSGQAFLFRCARWEIHRTQLLEQTETRRGNLSFCLGGKAPSNQNCEDHNSKLPPKRPPQQPPN